MEVPSLVHGHLKWDTIVWNPIIRKTLAISGISLVCTGEASHQHLLQNSAVTRKCGLPFYAKRKGPTRSTATQLVFQMGALYYTCATMSVLFGCCADHTLVKPIFNIQLVGGPAKLFSTFGNVQVTLKCPPATRLWILRDIREVLDFGTMIQRSSFSPFSNSHTQYRVSSSKHSKYHWVHKIFSALDWSEISAHPGWVSCILAHRMGPISPSSALVFIPGPHFNFWTCTTSLLIVRIYSQIFSKTVGDTSTKAQYRINVDT